MERFSENSTRSTGTVGLAAAAAIAGVSISTLRRWADEGRVPAFRTPGGHRRFRVADLQRALVPASAHAPSVEVLGHLATARIRRQLATPRVRELDWLSGLDERARERLRLVGRHLLATVEACLTRQRPRAAVLAEARQFGLLYGRELAAARFSIRQGLEAFTFFRRSLEEAARRYAHQQGLSPAEIDDLRDQLDALHDRILLGIAEAYDNPSAPPPAGAPEPTV